ncbi:hypothetical protein HD806DRAFT_538252 [Xylariaceae sp. AK1471]|nr:hypothetical protein HD806DRAFT_538252 [Xylariaceae sp. AK1471]
MSTVTTVPANRTRPRARESDAERRKRLEEQIEAERMRKLVEAMTEHKFRLDGSLLSLRIRATVDSMSFVARTERGGGKKLDHKFKTTLASREICGRRSLDE